MNDPKRYIPYDPKEQRETDLEDAAIIDQIQLKQLGGEIVVTYPGRGDTIISRKTCANSFVRVYTRAQGSEQLQPRAFAALNRLSERAKLTWNAAEEYDIKLILDGYEPTQPVPGLTVIHL